MGALLRLFIVLFILAALGAYLLGYRVRDGRLVGPNGAVATTGPLPEVDTTKAREVGAAIGDKVAVGATAAQHALANTALTGKIKAKIALDDTLDASNISVDTVDGVVTLTGTVTSDAQRTRAVQLARETDGVKSVTDRIKVQK
jgi:hyperosmotically inducible protein